MMKSLEVGYWVDEEPYELSDAFPAAQVINFCFFSLSGVNEYILSHSYRLTESKVFFRKVHDTQTS